MRSTLLSRPGAVAVEELVELRAALAHDQVRVPLAADESIRRAADPERVALAGAADIAVIKVAPLGGVPAALRVARAAGLPVVVSSAVDTSVGLAAGLALVGVRARRRAGKAR